MSQPRTVDWREATNKGGLWRDISVRGKLAEVGSRTPATGARRRARCQLCVNGCSKRWARQGLCPPPARPLEGSHAPQSRPLGSPRRHTRVGARTAGATLNRVAPLPRTATHHMVSWVRRGDRCGTVAARSPTPPRARPPPSCPSPSPSFTWASCTTFWRFWGQVRPPGRGGAAAFWKPCADWHWGGGQRVAAGVVGSDGPTHPALVAAAARRRRRRHLPGLRQAALRECRHQAHPQVRALEAWTGGGVAAGAAGRAGPTWAPLPDSCG
jgi:hypothetical protein